MPRWIETKKKRALTEGRWGPLGTRHRHVKETKQANLQQIFIHSRRLNDTDHCLKYTKCKSTFETFSTNHRAQKSLWVQAQTSP